MEILEFDITALEQKVDALMRGLARLEDRVAEHEEAIAELGYHMGDVDRAVDKHTSLMRNELSSMLGSLEDGIMDLQEQVTALDGRCAANYHNGLAFKQRIEALEEKGNADG